MLTEIKEALRKKSLFIYSLTERATHWKVTQSSSRTAHRISRASGCVVNHAPYEKEAFQESSHKSW